MFCYMLIHALDCSRSLLRINIATLERAGEGGAAEWMMLKDFLLSFSDDFLIQSCFD